MRLAIETALRMIVAEESEIRMPFSVVDPMTVAAHAAELCCHTALGPM
jgi:hypothetical protein